MPITQSGSSTLNGESETWALPALISQELLFGRTEIDQSNGTQQNLPAVLVLNNQEHHIAFSEEQMIAGFSSWSAPSGSMKVIRRVLLLILDWPEVCRKYECFLWQRESTYPNLVSWVGRRPENFRR
jgi:hypothetical protein